MLATINTQPEFQYSKENHVNNQTGILPPTPTTSDEELEEEQIKQRVVKLQRRGTVSLADLIPLATAAHKAKHRTSILYENPDSSNTNSALARALTKVKLGLQTHKLKEKWLTNEWIRLALALPVDDSDINKYTVHSKNLNYRKYNRTKEIVRWYEHQYKRSILPLPELEARVDDLRQQRLIYIQQQQEQQQMTNDLLIPILTQVQFTSSYTSDLPSPPI